MTDEQHKHVVSKLIDFIDRASGPKATNSEIAALPAIVQALAELQRR